MYTSIEFSVVVESSRTMKTLQKILNFADKSLKIDAKNGERFEVKQLLNFTLNTEPTPPEIEELPMQRLEFDSNSSSNEAWLSERAAYEHKIERRLKYKPLLQAEMIRRIESTFKSRIECAKHFGLKDVTLHNYLDTLSASISRVFFDRLLDFLGLEAGQLMPAHVPFDYDYLLPISRREQQRV